MTRDGLVEASGQEVLTNAEACIKQRFIDLAAALLVLHSPDIDLRAADAPGRLNRLLRCAGPWMHSVYLSAARLNIGMTALGDFDDEFCKRLTQLDPSTELVYLVALGEEDPFGQKFDRAPLAFSHGLSARLEPTLEERSEPSRDYAC